MTLQQLFQQLPERLRSLGNSACSHVGCYCIGDKRCGNCDDAEWARQAYELLTRDDRKASHGDSKLG